MTFEQWWTNFGRCLWRQELGDDVCKHRAQITFESGQKEHEAVSKEAKKAVAARDEAGAHADAYDQILRDCHHVLNQAGVPGAHLKKRIEGLVKNKDIDGLHKALDELKAPKPTDGWLTRIKALAAQRDDEEKAKEAAYSVMSKVHALLDHAGAEHTLLERRIENVINDAKQAKLERDACHQLMDEAFRVMGYNPRGPRPGLVDAVKHLREALGNNYHGAHCNCYHCHGSHS